MRKVIYAAIPAFFVGIAIGFAVSHHVKDDAKNPPAATQSDKKSKGLKRSHEDNSDLRALRSRIRELERQLSDDSSKDAEDVQDKRGDKPNRGNQNFNISQWLERMKTENPEQYAQYTNRFHRWRDMRRNQVVSKLDFLSSIDTSMMNAKEKETHEELQRLIEVREEMQSNFEKAFASGTMSNKDRAEQFEELRNIDRQISRLNALERQMLIKKTAEEIGFVGDDANEIAGTITKIIEATEGGFGGRGRGSRVSR